MPLITVQIHPGFGHSSPDGPYSGSACRRSCAPRVFDSPPRQIEVEIQIEIQIEIEIEIERRTAISPARSFRSPRIQPHQSGTSLKSDLDFDLDFDVEGEFDLAGDLDLELGEEMSSVLTVKQ